MLSSFLLHLEKSLFDNFTEEWKHGNQDFMEIPVQRDGIPTKFVFQISGSALFYQTYFFWGEMDKVSIFLLSTSWLQCSKNNFCMLVPNILLLHMSHDSCLISVILPLVLFSMVQAIFCYLEQLLKQINFKQSWWNAIQNDKDQRRGSLTSLLRVLDSFQ